MQNSTLLNNPPQCTGVPVTLTAVDPNGNTINIGTTASNRGGHFAYQWTPTIRRIIHYLCHICQEADSYFTSSWSNFSNRCISSNRQQRQLQATQPVVSNSDMIMYFAATGIAIIIAIAIATVLILRKK